MNIDLDNINEEMIYQAFGVDGKEAEALNDSYLELFELLNCKSRFPSKRESVIQTE